MYVVRAGFSVDQSSGALTLLAGSPFNAGQCGTVVPSGTIGIPGPDNMAIASAGKFMHDNCGSTHSIRQAAQSGKFRTRGWETGLSLIPLGLISGQSLRISRHACIATRMCRLTVLIQVREGSLRSTMGTCCSPIALSKYPQHCHHQIVRLSE